MFVIMMKRFLFAISFILAFFTASAQSYVSVNAEIDSCQRLIGEQARIKLKVGIDAGKRALLPIFDKEIVEGVEVVEKLPNDTQYLNDGKRMLITEEYVVTSFDSALYVIPAFEVLVDGEPFYSEELAMAVYMMPVDTTNLEQFFPPKDIWAVELGWNDYKSAVGYFFLFFKENSVKYCVILACTQILENCGALFGECREIIVEDKVALVKFCHILLDLSLGAHVGINGK